MKQMDYIDILKAEVEKHIIDPVDIIYNNEKDFATLIFTNEKYPFDYKVYNISMNILNNVSAIDIAGKVVATYRKFVAHKSYLEVFRG